MPQLRSNLIEEAPYLPKFYEVNIYKAMLHCHCWAHVYFPTGLLFEYGAILLSFVNNNSIYVRPNIKYVLIYSIEKE